MAREFEPTPQQRDLMDFLIKAKREGYASGVAPIDEPDGTRSTRFKEGDYEFHDNWYGEDGTPFGGIEKVEYKGELYWEMIYFGKELVDDRVAMGVLRQALMSMPDDMPARGPKLFQSGEYEYKNEWEGNIDYFSGSEVITRGDTVVYSLSYIGRKKPLNEQTS